MSLQMLWSLFAGHPAKLINLFALVLTCPGGMLLHRARRCAARAQSSSIAAEAAMGMLVQRINRFYYSLGFAFLAMALLLSWVSTWV